MAKDSLVKGTIILAVAALVARVLGVVQRVPLVDLLGDGGMATYGIAFNLYMMLLVVATAGIPSALSLLVAEKTALGQYGEANRIYRAAAIFALAAGAIITVLLVLLAPFYAQFSGDPDATLAIRALAPALLLFPLIAIMRGYFQGRQRMTPNGMSQVVEQVVRIVVAVGLAYWLFLLGWGIDWAVAGATFGGVAGSIAAFLVMLYYALKLRNEDRRNGETGDKQPVPPAKLRAIYKRIFAASVPIVLFSLAVPLVNTIDSSITIRLLQPALAYEAAKDTLGVLTGRAQSLAGIPIILAIALSQSTVPVISAAFARKDEALVSSQASKALYISVITGLPIMIAICAAARPINIFLFKNDTGTWTIVALTAIVLFQVVMQTSGAILMGIGQLRPLVKHVIIGIVVKIVASIALAPFLGIYGIVLSTGLCFLVMSQLNLRLLHRHVPFTILGRKWAGLVVTVAVVTAGGFGLEWVLHQYAQWFGPRLSGMLASIVIGGVVVVLYIALLAVTKVVTRDDVSRLPAPIQKVLRRVTAATKG